MAYYCQGCPQLAQALAMDKVNVNIESLKKEYEEWQLNPENLGKPIPPQFVKVAPKITLQPTINQGGVLATKENILFRENAKTLYAISQYAPLTGDLHDIKDIVTNASKGDFAAAGMSAIFLIPGSDFLKPVKSLVKSDKQLLKFAKETFEGSKAFSKEASDLVDIYRKGGNPGKGTKDIGDGIMELRGANTRVYFREGKDGMEVLGYSTKNNQQKVIDRVKAVYGKK